MNCCGFFLNVTRKTCPYYLPPPRLWQELTEAQRAQIEDIVIRKTGVGAESIVISTVNAN